MFVECAVELRGLGSLVVKYMCTSKTGYFHNKTQKFHRQIFERIIITLYTKNIARGDVPCCPHLGQVTY